MSKIPRWEMFTWSGTLVYSRFVSRLNNEDFFVKEEELTFTKPALKKMLDDGTINSVERGYHDSEGFNRIR